MQLSETALFNFAQSIPDRCRRERSTILQAGQGKWDTYVRKNFANALENWFRDYFHLPIVKSNKYVFIEGHNTIPYKLRGKAFFGTTMHPDAALIMDNKCLMAIELDHGKNGSQMRNALAKASFSVLLGKFRKAMVLFFVDPPKSAIDFKRSENEERILDLYQLRFNTTLHII
jgi:hypothetical protein